MVSVAILVGVALFLFAGSFFSKRRFGLLGLALTAGYVLAGLWHDTAEFMISALGILPDGVVTSFAATMVLLLFPALLLFFHGYTYKSVTGRLVGSTLFTFLAIAFLATPMAKALVLDSMALQVFGWIEANANTVIGIGVMMAVFDIFLSKPAGFSHKK